MTTLFKKSNLLGHNTFELELMLDDEAFGGGKRDEDKQRYILNVCISKEAKLNSNDIVNEVKNELFEYFLNSNKPKKTLYVASDYEIDEYGSGYIDVFYPVEYMNYKVDSGYETDDYRIGKNLMFIELDDCTETTAMIKIQFESVFLIDELYKLSTIWEIDNGRIYDFAVDEISAILSELEN